MNGGKEDVMLGPFMIVVWAAALACVIFTFIITGYTGKIIMGSILIIGIFISLVIPNIRLYINIAGLIIGLGCFVYLIGAGYMFNLRVFRGRKPHDRF